jgi:hypothetical protein
LHNLLALAAASPAKNVSNFLTYLTLRRRPNSAIGASLSVKAGRRSEKIAGKVRAARLAPGFGRDFRFAYWTFFIASPE